MAPFYGAPGILINGVQTGELIFSGNGVSYQNGVAAVNGFNVSNGTLTIDNPTILNLSGANQTLSESVVLPTIVQQSFSTTDIITLGASPTIGNLLLIIAVGAGVGYPYYTASNGFSLIAGQSDPGNYDGVIYAKIANGTENLSTTLNTSGFSGTSYIFEIKNYSGSLPFGQTHELSYSGSNPSCPALAYANNSLVFAAFWTNDSATFSSPLPAGFSIFSQSPGTCFLQGNGNGSTEIISVTTSITIGSYVYLYAEVQQNGLLVQANLSIT